MVICSWCSEKDIDVMLKQLVIMSFTSNFTSLEAAQFIGQLLLLTLIIKLFFSIST